MTQSLSVVIITHNEEANLARTLASVSSLLKEAPGEIIVVDSGSTDRTLEIAHSYGAKVFSEPWKGYAAQKNSAIEKASGDWILSLDADEEIEAELAAELRELLKSTNHEWCLTTAGRKQEPNEVLRQQIKNPAGFLISRKNLFLGRWIKRGGFWPDRKLRLFCKGSGRFEERAVHEIVKVDGITLKLKNALIHHAYPTLAGYIGHMNKYSSLGAEQAAKEGRRGFSFLNIVVRPLATFIYNYFFRLGFLDGREGLLLHLYHAAYTSWKYAKLWELTRTGGRQSN
jgi:glycosyltransferase involved in cell wall biosynthesis